MRLYSRDFNIITDQERSAWELLEREVRTTDDGRFIENLRRPIYYKFPQAIRHHKSLFPNNFLDAADLNLKSEELSLKLKSLNTLLDQLTTTEQDITKFIRSHNAYFLIGSILKNNYRFGHHACYIFPELTLAPKFRVDYLIIGENSDGHHFVFVELENPYNKITNRNGAFGDTIRKGITHIDNWEPWLESNFGFLRETFESSLGIQKSLPREFIVFDKSRIHFVVIAGRRKDFLPNTYRLQRNIQEQRKLQILHYDNLLDLSIETIGSSCY